MGFLVGMLMLATMALAQEGGLVAHFPLDEGSGEVVRDVGGIEGQIHGAAWVKLGKGHALSFDGEDDYVRCEAAEALDLRGPMSLSAWVWPEEVPTGEVGIAGKQFTSFLLTYYHDRKTWWYIGAGANHATAQVLPGTWSHVAGTFDGTRLWLYVNGELVDDCESKFASTPPGRSFFIGCVIGDPTADDPAYAKSGYFRGYIADVRLYSRAITEDEVGAQYEEEVAQRFAPVAVGCERIRGGETISERGLRVRVGRSGAVQISREGAFCIAESSFSYPGEKLGRNWLSEVTDERESGWRPEVRKVTGGLRVKAEAAHYRLERTVRIRDGRVEIADTLTNTSDTPVGVLIRHRVVTPKLLTKASLGAGSAEPIVFAGQPEYDLGIVAEDDISRVQFVPFCAANRAGFRLNHFGLAPGASHTFRWAIYLLESTGDPFDFVNVVRRHWKSNHTILGPASFFDAGGSIIGEPERLKQYLSRRKLRIAMLSPWLDYDPGSMDRVIPRDEYKAMMQRAAAAIKAADPEVKCIGCIETDWVTIYPERIEGGDRFPVDGVDGKHGGTAISPELAAIIEKAGVPWVDSMKRDPEGSAMLELYSRGGKPQTALGVYPATGNYQAQFLMQQAKFLCEDVGLDGFYIDEFSLFWVKSYDRWDGCTVDIDPRTGEILRQYTDASTAGIEFRRELCEYAVSRGAVMVANTFATTGAENALPVMRFAETWSSFDVLALPKTGRPRFNARLASGRLGTPIGLGVLRPREGVSSAELLMRGIILYLRHGMVYYHYFYGDIPETGEGNGEYGPINHMFPITPVRLFEGGIEGEERTITCVSGKYAWRHEERPKVLLFGPDGREIEGEHDLRRAKGGWEVDVTLRDWVEISVIER